MKGLKIIPIFLVLILLSYVGMLFVEANRDEVVITFFGSQTPAVPLGFVVLTSALIGMVVAGVLCVLELAVLYLQNKSLRRRLLGSDPRPSSPAPYLPRRESSPPPAAPPTKESAPEASASEAEPEGEESTHTDIEITPLEPPKKFN